MPKVKKKRVEKRVNYAAKENTRLRGAELVSSIYDEDRPRSTSFYDDDRPRSESGSFSSNPMVSINNMVRTPSPDILSVSVQLIEEDKKECPLQTTPKGKRNITCRFSSRSKGSFLNNSRNRLSPMYFSSERMKKYKCDNDLFIEEGFVDSHLNEKENICETPKIKYESLSITKRDSNLEVVEAKENIPEIKNNARGSLIPHKSQYEVMHLKGVVNINPYMDYQHVQMKSNKENVNELSFFTPDLLESKPASTPIHAVTEKEQTKLPFNDISNTSSMTNKARNLKDSVLRRSALTPIIVKEPLPEVNEEMKVQRKVTQFMSNTAPPGEVDATENMAKIAKAMNKVCQKSTSYETLVESSTSKDDTLGAMKKVLRHVHRYGAVTAKWTMSLFSVCMRLGFSVRPKIADTPCTHTEDLESIKTCSCNKYQQDVNNLKEKIVELSRSIEDLKKQVLENIQNNRKVETLNATLLELSKDVQNLKLLREEMDNLKNRFNTMSFSTIHQTPMSITRAPAPLAPPPPPPPPPPPLLSQVNKPNTLKKSSALSKAKSETPRPVISLDDILKVKLKKTSERSITTRRSTGSQPEVTQEMLQQVKLRKPLCRSMTPSMLPNISPEGSTSPHSNLRKLLRDDGSFRIKRLRRVDGYSFNNTNKNKLSRERQ